MKAVREFLLVILVDVVDYIVLFATQSIFFFHEGEKKKASRVEVDVAPHPQCPTQIHKRNYIIRSFIKHTK